MENDYREESRKKWQKSMLIIAAFICAIAFLVEIIIYFIYRVSGKIDALNSEYLIFRILTPTACNLTLFLVMIYFKNVKKESKVIRHRDDYMCFCLYAICLIIAVVHNFYHVTWIIPALCQFINSIYADKEGIKRNYRYINIALAIIVFFAFIERSYEITYLVVTAICAYAISFIIYLISTLLVNYNNEQIEYMEENYLRQKKLLEELDIESMTGIFNRNSLESRVGQVIDEHKNKKLNTYLVMLDIDHFKNINDRYGHTSGDEVILRLVRYIRGVIDGGVTAFRYGGEEFILLFRNMPCQKVFGCIDNMRISFSKEKYIFDENISITFSAGITGYVDGMSVDDFVESADKALYFAKENGRNRIWMVNISGEV